MKKSWLKYETLALIFTLKSRVSPDSFIVYKPVVVVSIGSGFLMTFSTSIGFSATVTIFSETNGVSISFVLWGVVDTDMGGGTGVTTGLLFVGSLFTRKTLISPVWLFKWIWYLRSIPSFWRFWKKCHWAITSLACDKHWCMLVEHSHKICSINITVPHYPLFNKHYSTVVLLLKATIFTKLTLLHQTIFHMTGKKTRQQYNTFIFVDFGMPSEVCSKIMDSTPHSNGPNGNAQCKHKK